jgi:integrase
MAIIKRGKVYWYEFIFDGKRIRCSTKSRNKKAAIKIEADARTKLALQAAGLAAPEPPESEQPAEPVLVPTLGEFAPRFEAHIRLRSAEKPETVRFYLSKLDRLLEYQPLADTRLDAVNAELIERYITHRTNKDLSPATVNRELATLRRLLYLAKRWNIILAVPKIDMLAGERAKDFVLSREQEANYLAFATGHLKDAALLAVDTGLRVGELAALRWEDVHLEPVGAARFGYLLVRSGKTKNARRTVPLTDRVSAMLGSRLRIGPRVFPVTANTLQHHHQDLRDKLGLDSDFTLHSLRHTALTRLGESGADAFTIKRLAGHHSITVSEGYVHPTPEHVERTFERFQAYGAPTKVTTQPEAQIEANAVNAVQ